MKEESSDLCLDHEKKKICFVHDLLKGHHQSSWLKVLKEFEGSYWSKQLFILCEYQKYSVLQQIKYHLMYLCDFSAL